jgi:hypothetical protein
MDSFHYHIHTKHSTWHFHLHTTFPHYTIIQQLTSYLQTTFSLYTTPYKIIVLIHIITSIANSRLYTYFQYLFTSTLTSAYFTSVNTLILYHFQALLGYFITSKTIVLHTFSIIQSYIPSKCTLTTTCLQHHFFLVIHQC